MSGGVTIRCVSPRPAIGNFTGSGVGGSFRVGDELTVEASEARILCKRGFEPASVEEARSQPAMEIGSEPPPEDQALPDGD